MGLERAFESSWTLRDMRREPLGMILDDFCDWLLDSGFSNHTVRKHLSQTLHLNRWLAEQGRHEARLSKQDIEDFLAVYSKHCRIRGTLARHLKQTRNSLNRFIKFLRHCNRFDSFSIAPVFQPLLDGYLHWMREHQHASDGTVNIRRHSVRRFLVSLGDEATPEGISKLSANGIEAYFLDYASQQGISARRSMQAALRTFLRFCFHEGYVAQLLDDAIPSLRVYKLARTPQGLGEDQVKRLLDSVNRNTASGKRDYAILKLLHTYGVRGGQVCALRLNDIRWAQDRILFRATKGGKDSLLPLTADVGESLLDYLRHGRPPSIVPEVFLTCHAPCHPLLKNTVLSLMVRGHIMAAGLDVPHKGSHIFRHAFATRMVADGHSFKEIADVLGHRCLSTTFIYTKVDFNALKQAALEWPEEMNT